MLFVTELPIAYKTATCLVAEFILNPGGKGVSMKQVRQLLQYLAMVTTLTVIFGTFDYLRAANFFCSSGNTTCLIAAINSANGLRGKHTINLESGVYTLQIIDNATDGANGLPSIKRSIEMRGSTGDLPVTIERDPSAPSFSIFHIALGGELSLEGVNVRRRDIAATMFGGGVAIFNRGVTILHESIVSDSSSGIYNTGTLKILEEYHRE